MDQPSSITGWYARPILPTRPVRSPHYRLVTNLASCANAVQQARNFGRGGELWAGAIAGWPPMRSPAMIEVAGRARGGGMRRNGQPLCNAMSGVSNRTRLKGVATPGLEFCWSGRGAFCRVLWSYSCTYTAVREPLIVRTCIHHNIYALTRIHYQKS